MIRDYGLVMRLLALLRDPPVALLWGGLSLSAIGDQLYAVALTWIAVGVLGASAGYLAALGAACVLGTALFAGRWADAWEQRGAMIAADVTRALVLIVVVLDWSFRGHPTAIALILATIILAGGQAIFRPALQGLLPGLVRDRAQLPAANALLDSTDRVARLLGPGLVAALAALVPVKHFLSLDSASFLFSATALLLIGRLHPLPARHQTHPPQSFFASALHGFRAVAAHPILRLNLQVTGIINGAWYAVIFLGLPLVIARHAPGSAGLGAYGLIISSYGCTNLAATLVIGSRKMPESPGRTIFAGHLVLGIGLMMMALAASTPLPPAISIASFAASASIGAIGGPLHDIPVAVLRQTDLPRADVPAAMRAYLVANSGGLLAAMLIVPPLYAALPVPGVIAFCAMIIAAIGVAGMARFSARPILADPS
ncbi:MAG TPA: MFS transporter [Acetobacteraceae bacterium]|nr:MFS transporter [Acetobacteraceae bacterium]